MLPDGSAARIQACQLGCNILIYLLQFLQRGAMNVTLPQVCHVSCRLSAEEQQTALVLHPASNELAMSSGVGLSPFS